MKDEHLLAIFFGILVGANFAMAMGWIPENFLWVNLALLLGFGAIFFLKKYRIDRPKSLYDSYEAARRMLARIKTGEDSSDFVPDDIVEMARYKESVLATKKGVVHRIVLKSGGETWVFKDDAYVRENPASIIAIGKGFFKPKVVKSVLEIEKEMKPLFKPEYVPVKKKYEKKIKVEEKPEPKAI